MQGNQGTDPPESPPQTWHLKHWTDPDCGCEREPSWDHNTICPDHRGGWCERHEMNHNSEVECPQCAREEAPGTPGILWVSAYAVTRHYGGPEEGGWWYDCGECLASIPIAAHWIGVEGETKLRAKVPAQQIAMQNHLTDLFMDLKHGNIGSVLGGTDVQFRIEDQMGANWPTERPRYE